MTSKLKCPFCGEELKLIAQDAYGNMFCPKCKVGDDQNAYIGDIELWQALIQAKQDLEIARKALEEIDMLLHSRKFDITELGRLNIIQYLVSRVLKLTEHKE